jgi:D-serine deaminase-like pyridoxal phosphate-dependent protein
MPTHMGAFAEAAARFAGVDPADWPAVQAFFTQTLATLPVPQRQAITDFLLKRSGSATRYGVVVEFDPVTWWGTIRSATQLYGFHGTQVRGATTTKLPRVGDRVRFVPTSTDRTRILQVFPGTDP